MFAGDLWRCVTDSFSPMTGKSPDEIGRGDSVWLMTEIAFVHPSVS